MLNTLKQNMQKNLLLKLCMLLFSLSFINVAMAQSSSMNAGVSSVAEQQKKAREKAKAKEAAEKAAAEAKRKEDASKNPQNLKVVKMQPKVRQRARTFATVSCRSLSGVKPAGSEEARNLNKRKQECVKQAAAFEKGYK